MNASSMTDSPERDLLSDATIDTFRPLVGRTFLVRGAVAPIPLTLSEATPGPSAPPNMRAPFSLIFKAALDVRMPQGTYWVSTEGWGQAAMFLVPIRPTPEHTCYQAVFG